MSLPKFFKAQVSFTYVFYSSDQLLSNKSLDLYTNYFKTWYSLSFEQYKLVDKLTHWGLKCRMSNEKIVYETLSMF